MLTPILLYIVATIVKTTNRLLSKLKDKVFYRNHKGTWQGVSNVFLYYLYKRVMVCANGKYQDCWK